MRPGLWVALAALVAAPLLAPLAEGYARTVICVDMTDAPPVVSINPGESCAGDFRVDGCFLIVVVRGVPEAILPDGEGPRVCIPWPLKVKIARG